MKKLTRSSDLQILVGVFFLAATIAFILLTTGCGNSGYVLVKGDTGEKGDPGQVGGTGPAGPQGAPGSPGLNATPVTMIKLCPGVTTYPTVFVEYAFCIGGSLYATYSANDGFTTILPPGRYSSNAIGSSCNFIVTSGCNIK